MSNSNNTVDKNEIEHFEKLVWWSENSSLKMLLAMNRLRVPFVTESVINNKLIKDNQIKSPTPLLGLKIADVGCGGGYFSEALARLGAQVTGIDACGAAIKEARQHAALDSTLSFQPTYLETTIEEHAETHKEFYDVVVSSEVIEHVENKTAFLKYCNAVLKSGGSLILTTISKTFTSWLIVIQFSERVLGTIPRGTHQYSKLITSDALRVLLKENHFDTSDVRKMFYYLGFGWTWTSLMETFYAISARKN